MSALRDKVAARDGVAVARVRDVFGVVAVRALAYVRVGVVALRPVVVARDFCTLFCVARGCTVAVVRADTPRIGVAVRASSSITAVVALPRVDWSVGRSRWVTDCVVVRETAADLCDWGTLLRVDDNVVGASRRAVAARAISDASSATAPKKVSGARNTAKSSLGPFIPILGY